MIVRTIEKSIEEDRNDLLAAKRSKRLNKSLVTDNSILQDQDGVLAWVAERLAVAMRKENILMAHVKPTLIDLEALQGDKGEGESHAERLNEMAA